MTSKLKRLTLLCIFAAVLCGCGPRGKLAEDPYEHYNRRIFNFNQKCDKKIFRPIAKTYLALVPWPIRTGISNFFSNLDDISSLANDLLQLQFQHAIVNTWRVGINSTLGVAGIIDFASHMQLKKRHNDLGITFAKWGDTQSPYVIMPFLGPSTIRDSAGVFFDYYFFNPVSYFRSFPLRLGIVSLGYLDSYTKFVAAEELLSEIAIDPYTFQRDAYLQRRQSFISETSGDTSKSGDDDDDPYVEDDEEKKEDKKENKGGEKNKDKKDSKESEKNKDKKDSKESEKSKDKKDSKESEKSKDKKDSKESEKGKDKKDDKEAAAKSKG